MLKKIEEVFITLVICAGLFYFVFFTGNTEGRQKDIFIYRGEVIDIKQADPCGEWYILRVKGEYTSRIWDVLIHKTQKKNVYLNDPVFFSRVELKDMLPKSASVYLPDIIARQMLRDGKAESAL